MNPHIPYNYSSLPYKQPKLAVRSDHIQFNTNTITTTIYNTVTQHNWSHAVNILHMNVPAHCVNDKLMNANVECVDNTIQFNEWSNKVINQFDNAYTFISSYIMYNTLSNKV